MKKRAKLITKGGQLEAADAGKLIVRRPEENIPPSPPVDYEKLNRKMREFGTVFTEEMCKAANRLCEKCRSDFSKAWQAAFHKASAYLPEGVEE